MKCLLAAIFGLLTFSNLLAFAFGEDIDCGCLEDLDV